MLRHQQSKESITNAKEQVQVVAKSKEKTFSSTTSPKESTSTCVSEETLLEQKRSYQRHLRALQKTMRNEQLTQQQRNSERIAANGLYAARILKRRKCLGANSVELESAPVGTLPLLPATSSPTSMQSTSTSMMTTRDFPRSINSFLGCRCNQLLRGMKCVCTTTSTTSTRYFPSTTAEVAQLAALATLQQVSQNSLAARSSSASETLNIIAAANSLSLIGLPTTSRMRHVPISSESTNHHVERMTRCSNKNVMPSMPMTFQSVYPLSPDESKFTPPVSVPSTYNMSQTASSVIAKPIARLAKKSSSFTVEALLSRWTQIALIQNFIAYSWHLFLLYRIELPENEYRFVLIPWYKLHSPMLLVSALVFYFVRQLIQLPTIFQADYT